MFDAYMDEFINFMVKSGRFEEWYNTVEWGIGGITGRLKAVRNIYWVNQYPFYDKELGAEWRNFCECVSNEKL